MTTPITPAVRADLAPAGTLRAGVNYGNFILATRDPATGESRGVAIDLLQDVGRRLAVPVEIVSYESVAVMVDAAKTGAWDMAFLGIDPAREGEIGFTAAYLEIEATYLVPAGSRIATVADVDREGVRVVAAARANYELFLTRELKRAELVRAPGHPAAFEALQSGRADVLAGLRQALLGLTERLPGSRVLDGGFLNSFVAIAVPKNKAAALAYVSTFLEEAKASGSVRRSLESSGLPATIAAPAGARP